MGWLGDAIGSIFGNRESSKAQSKNDAWNWRSYNLARDTFNWQKDYIQNRTADARKAGIHPLYALGTPGVNASFEAGSLPGEPAGQSLFTLADMAGRAYGSSKRRKAAASTAAVAQAESASRARLNDAEAQMVDSQRKRLEMEMVRQPAKTHALVDRALTPPRKLITRPTDKGFTPSRTTPAELVEEEYGDLGGSIYGLWRAAMDSIDMLRQHVREGGGPRASFKGWKVKPAQPGAARY